MRQAKAHNRSKLLGKRFHRFTVIADAGTRTYGDSSQKSAWLCRCICGAERVVDGGSLISGNSKSCGCLQKDKRAKGKRTGTRTYRIWQAMLNRCRNKNVPNYHNYGGRGIEVCERWKDYKNFLSDMGEAPDDMSIERIDNNGNYELRNCKWADRKEQSRNKRSNRIICFRGEKKLLRDWADDIGIDQSSLRERLDKWPLSKALTTPKAR